MVLEGLDFRYEKNEEGKDCIKCIHYSRKGHRVKLFLSTLWMHKGKQEYNSTHSSLQLWMEECGQLHAVTINPGIGPWCQLNRRLGGPQSRLIIQIWNSENHVSWYILIIKTNEMHHFSNLFRYRTLHISDRFTVHHQTAIGIPIAVYTVLDSWW